MHINSNQIQINSNQMLVSEERGKLEYPGENLSEQSGKNQQTRPTYDAECKNWTQAILVGGKCSHQYIIPAT